MYIITTDRASSQCLRSPSPHRMTLHGYFHKYQTINKIYYKQGLSLVIDHLSKFIQNEIYLYHIN